MKVIATIQSTLDGDHPPVDMTWYTGNDGVEAMVAIGQVVARPVDEYTRTLSVRVEF